jgi:tetratricopeptide (TPR) repeat protein
MTAPRKEVLSVGRTVWSRPRRILVYGVVLLGAVFAGAIGGYYWWREAIPEPPVVELANLEPSAVAAIREARAAVMQSSRSAEAWGRLGVFLLTCSYRPEARACFACAERLDRRDLRWPYLQAQAYALNDPEAIPKLQRALDLDPQPRDSVRLQLAETLLAQGRLREAEPHFRAALRSDPANPRAHLGLARLAFTRGVLEASLASLSHAAASPETRKAACALLAQVHQAQGDAAAAAQDAQRLSQLPADSPVLSPYFARETGQLLENKIALFRAEQMVLKGRLGEAAAVLRQQTAKYPDWGRAWVKLGQILFWGQKYKEAKQALSKAARLLPDSAQPHCYLGNALVEQGKHPEAAAAFRQATDLQPDYAEAHFGLSRCLQALGDRNGAEQALRAAIRYLPTYAQARAALGELLAKSGRPAEGLEQLHSAARLQPDDEHIHKLLQQWEAQGSAGPMPQETPKK